MEASSPSLALRGHRGRETGVASVRRLISIRGPVVLTRKCVPPSWQLDVFINLLKVKCCHLGSLLCVNTKTDSSTELAQPVGSPDASADPYKPVMLKWISKDYHHLENTQAHAHGPGRSLRVREDQQALGNPSLSSATSLRLKLSRPAKTSNWTLTFQNQSSESVCRTKWLRDAFLYWQESSRQEVLWDAIE